jgi:hypothetical protein
VVGTGVRQRTAVARRVALGLLVFVLALATAACGASSSGGSGGGDSASDDGGIEVPDVTGDDGANAVSSGEDAGLTATLADANDDPGFDAGRDATGCEVTD